MLFIYLLYASCRLFAGKNCCSRETKLKTDCCCTGQRIFGYGYTVNICCLTTTTNQKMTGRAGCAFACLFCYLILFLLKAHVLRVFIGRISWESSIWNIIITVWCILCHILYYYNPCRYTWVTRSRRTSWAESKGGSQSVSQ